MAESLDNLNLIAECSICTEIFKHPMVLPCQHHFCKVCIDEWINTNSVDGLLNCPLCRDVCAVSAIKHSFFMEQIIDYNAKKKALKHMDAHSNFSICSKHNHPLKYYCQTCDKAICSECGMDDHQTHRTMNMEQYFKRMEGTIKQYIQQLKRKSTSLRAHLSVTMSTLQDLDQTKLAIQQQIMRKSDEEVAKVIARRDQLLGELEDTVSASKKNTEISKSDVELHLANTENLSIWAEAIISGGPSSGAEISKDLLNQLKRCAEMEHKAPTLLTPVFMPSASQTSETNPIGSLQTEDISSGLKELSLGGGSGAMAISSDRSSRRITFSLKEQFSKTITKSSHLSIGKIDCIRRLCYHNAHIWVTCYEGKCIDKYTVQGELVQTIPLVQQPKAVHPVSHNQFAMAAYEGLYLLTTDGSVVSTLATGEYVDVHVGDYVTAVKCVGIRQNKVELYNLHGDTVRLHNSFNVDKGEWCRTVLALDNCIYVSFITHVSQYSLQGEKLSHYGTLGGTAPGELRNAYLCCQDTTGCLLVADRVNSRLQLLDNHGNWKLVPLPECDYYISDAILTSNNTLYVLFVNSTIKCYTIN